MDAETSSSIKGNRFRNRVSLVLGISFVVYVTYWSVISLLKFYYFQDTIFDLGVAMQSLWTVTNSSWTYATVFRQFAYQGIVFLMFPLIYGGYVAIIIFQTVFIALGSVAIYQISRLHGLEVKVSALISISFLLYFPLSGMNWFDFHFQSLFVTLFLFGYLFYLKGNYWLSSLIFFISGIVRFPYAVFPLFFWTTAWIFDRKPAGNRNLKLASVLNVLIYVPFLILSYFTLHGGYITTHVSGITNPLSGLPVKLLTLAVMVAPFLFLPLLSKRWIFFLAPFVGLMFIANNPIYEFPYLFKLQYSASFIAFLFLGLVDVLGNGAVSNVHERLHKLRGQTRRKRKKMPLESGHNPLRIVGLVFIVVLLFATTYQATGPLQILKNDNISLDSFAGLNQNQYEEYKIAASFIPHNNPYVLIQNNLPQFLPGLAGNDLRVAGYIGPNITEANIAENSFPWVYGQFYNMTPIDYIFADLNSTTWFQSTIVSGFPSLENLTHSMLASGYYGILAQCGPFIVIKRGYNGPPEKYSPYSASLKLEKQTSSNITLNGFNNETTSGNGTTLYTSSFNMAPGNYTLTISMSGSSDFLSNLTFGVVVRDNQTGPYDIIAFETYSGSATNAWNLTFTMPNVYYDVRVFIEANNISLINDAFISHISQTSFQVY